MKNSPTAMTTLKHYLQFTDLTADEYAYLFERAALISEYKNTKPPLQPPANLLCFTYSLLQWLLAKFCPGFVGNCLCGPYP